MVKNDRDRLVRADASGGDAQGIRGGGVAVGTIKGTGAVGLYRGRRVQVLGRTDLLDRKTRFHNVRKTCFFRLTLSSYLPSYTLAACRVPGHDCRVCRNPKLATHREQKRSDPNLARIIHRHHIPNAFPFIQHYKTSPSDLSGTSSPPFPSN